MDNFKFLTTDNRRLVIFRNLVVGEIAQCDDGEYIIFRNLVVGEIAQCDDGEYVFFPDQQRTGFIRLWMMEAIAAELKRLNYGQVIA